MARPKDPAAGYTGGTPTAAYNRKPGDDYTGGTPTAAYNIPEDEQVKALRPDQDFSKEAVAARRKQLYANTAGKAFELRHAAEAGRTLDGYPLPVTPIENYSIVGTPAMTQTQISKYYLEEADRLMQQWDDTNKPLPTTHPALVKAAENARAAGVPLMPVDLANLATFSQIDAPANKYLELYNSGNVNGAKNVFLTLKKDSPQLAAIFPEYLEAKIAEEANKALYSGDNVKTKSAQLGDVALKGLEIASIAVEGVLHGLRAASLDETTSKDPSSPNYSPEGAQDAGAVGDFIRRMASIPQNWDKTEKGQWNQTKLAELKQEYPPSIIDAAVVVAQAGAEGKPDKIMELWKTTKDEQVLNLLGDLLEGGPRQSEFDLDELVRKIEEANAGSLGPMIGNAIFDDKMSGSYLRNMTSDVANVAATLALDPINYIAPYARAATATRYSILRIAPEAASGSIPKAFKSVKVAGLETNRVRRYYEGFLREVDRMEDMGLGSWQAARQDSRIARQYKWIPNDVAKYFQDNVTRVDGKRYIDSLPEGGSGKTLVDTIEDANDAWRIHAGDVTDAAREAGIDYAVNRAMAAKILDEATPEGLQRAKDAGLIPKEIIVGAKAEEERFVRNNLERSLADRMVKGDRRGATLPYTGVLADLRRRTVNATILGQMNSRRTEAIVNRFMQNVESPLDLANMLEDKYKSFGAETRRVRLWGDTLPGRRGAILDEITRLGSTMPNLSEGLNVSGGSNAIQLYKFARQFFSRDVSALIFHNFRMADEGTRRLIAAATIRSGAAATGVNISKEEALARIDRLATTGMKGERYALETPGMPSALMMKANLDAGRAAEASVKESEAAIAKAQALLDDAENQSLLLLDEGMDPRQIANELARARDEVVTQQANIIKQNEKVKRMRAAIFKALGEEDLAKPSPLFDELPVAIQEAPIVAVIEPAAVVDEVVTKAKPAAVVADSKPSTKTPVAWRTIMNGSKNPTPHDVFILPEKPTAPGTKGAKVWITKDVWDEEHVGYSAAIGKDVEKSPLGGDSDISWGMDGRIKSRGSGTANPERDKANELALRKSLYDASKKYDIPVPESLTNPYALLPGPMSRSEAWDSLSRVSLGGMSRDELNDVTQQLAKKHPEWVEPRVKPASEKPGPNDPKPIDIFRNQNTPDYVYYPFRERADGTLGIVGEPDYNAIQSAKDLFNEVVEEWEKISPLNRNYRFERWVDEQKFVFGKDFSEAQARELYDATLRSADMPTVESVRESTPGYVKITDAMGKAIEAGDDDLASVLHEELDAMAPQINKQWAQEVLSDPQKVDDFLASVGLKQGEESPEWTSEFAAQWEDEFGSAMGDMAPLPDSLRNIQSFEDFVQQGLKDGVVYTDDIEWEKAWAKSVLKDDSADQEYLDFLGHGKETPEDLKAIAGQIRDIENQKAMGNGFAIDSTGKGWEDPDIPKTYESIVKKKSSPRYGKPIKGANPAWSDWQKNGLITPKALEEMAASRGEESVWSWWHTGTWDAYYNDNFMELYGPSPAFVDGKIPGEYMLGHDSTRGANIKKLRPPFFKTEEDIKAGVDSYLGEAQMNALKEAKAGLRTDEIEQFIDSLKDRSNLTPTINKRDAWVAERIDLARYRLIESAEQGSDTSPLLAYHRKLENHAKAMADKSDLPDLPQTLITDIDGYIPDWLKARGSLNSNGFQEEIGGVVYSIETSKGGITVKMWRKGWQQAWNKKEGDVWSIGMPNASVHWRDGKWVKGGSRMNLDKAPSKKDLDQVTEYAKELDNRYNLEPHKQSWYGQETNPGLDLQQKMASGEYRLPDSAPEAQAAPLVDEVAPVVDEAAPMLDEAAPVEAPPVAAPAKVVDPNVYTVHSMDGLDAKVSDYMARIGDPIASADNAVRWSPSVDDLGRQSAMHLYQTTRNISLPHLAEIEAIRRFRSTPVINQLPKYAQMSTDIWSLLTLYGFRFSQRSAIEDLLAYVLTDGLLHMGDLAKGRRASTAARDAKPILKIVEKNPGGKTELPEFEVTAKSRLGMVAKRSRKYSTWIADRQFMQNRQWFRDMMTTDVPPERVAEVVTAQARGNSGPMRELLGEVIIRQKVSGLNETIDGARQLTPEGRDIQDLMSTQTGQRIVHSIAEDASNANSGLMSMVDNVEDEFADFPDIELARIKQPVTYGEFKNLGLSAKDDQVSYATDVWHRKLQTIVNDDGPIGKVFVIYAFQPEKAKAAIAKVIREDKVFNYKERYSLIGDDGAIDRFAANYYEASLPYFLRHDRTFNHELRNKFISYGEPDNQEVLLGGQGREVNVQWRVTDEKGRNRPVVSVSDLKKMDTLDKPEYVLGRERANIPMPKNDKGIMDRAWHWMGEQYARIAREPVFYANYLSNRRALRPREDAIANMLAKSAGREVSDADRMVARTIADRQAQDAAYTFSISYMDNPNNRSILAYKIRNFSRYYRATEDFARRAGRLAQNYPDAYYKMAMTYQVLDDTGFTYRDSNGDLYFAYPGNQILQEAMTTVFGSIGGGGFGVGTAIDAFFMGGRVKSIAPSTDPMQWLPTASGITMTIPLVTLFNFAPQLQGLRSMTLGEYSTAGQNGNILADYVKAIAPASVQKMWNAMSPGEQDAATASSVAGAVSMMVANGMIDDNMLTDGTQTTEMFKTTDQYHDAQRISTGLFLTKLLLGFTVPASPQTYQNNVSDAARNAGIDEASDLWHSLMNEYKDDPATAYSEWVRLDTSGALLPFTVSGTKTNDEVLKSIPGFQPYKTVVDWHRAEGSALSEKYPVAYMFLAPTPGPDEEFSGDARSKIKTLGFRVARSEDELLTEILAAKPYAQLGYVKAQFDAEIEALDPENSASDAELKKTLEDERSAAITDILNSSPTVREKDRDKAMRYSNDRMAPLFFATMSMTNDMRQKNGGNLTGAAADLEAANNVWVGYNEEMAGLSPHTNAGKAQRKELKAQMQAELDSIAASSPQAANYIRSVLNILDYGSLS